MKLAKHNSISSRNFRFSTFFNYLILGIVGFITFYPFWYVLMYSLSTYKNVLDTKVLLIPAGFTFENYTYVFSDSYMYTGALNSMFVTTVGTILSLIITMLISMNVSKRKISFKIWNATYIEAEQEQAEEDGKEYDCMLVEISGEELLEVLEDGKEV